MDPDCGDVFAWYKKVCLELPHRPTLDGYECPDFSARLTMDDLNAMSDADIKYLKYTYKLQHVMDPVVLKTEIYEQVYLTDLAVFIDDLEEYTLKAVQCATAREEHYRKCIYKTMEEEQRHHEWRIGFTKVAERCRDTLAYWKHHLAARSQASVEKRVTSLNKNRKRRDKAKLARRLEREQLGPVQNPDEGDVTIVNRVGPPDPRAQREKDIAKREVSRMQQRKRQEEEQLLDKLVREKDEELRVRQERREQANQELRTVQTVWKSTDIDAFLEETPRWFDVALHGGDDVESARLFLDKFSTLVTVPLSLAQTKVLVSHLLFTVQHPTLQPLWDTTMNYMIMYAPSIAKEEYDAANFPLLVGGKLNKPGTPITKDTYLNFIYVMDDAYINEAIRRENFDWHPEVVNRTLALLDRHSAQFLLNKLSLRSKSAGHAQVYYDQYVSKMFSFLCAHTYYFAMAVQQWYADHCLTAQRALCLYDKYMDDQEARSPLQFTNRHGQPDSVRIALVEDDSVEAKVLKNVRKKTRRAGEAIAQ